MTWDTRMAYWYNFMTLACRIYSLDHLLFLLPLRFELAEKKGIVQTDVERQLDNILSMEKEKLFSLVAFGLHHLLFIVSLPAREA